eukprot:9607442-Prorocentrum_lima.AAC.1
MGSIAGCTAGVRVGHVLGDRCACNVHQAHHSPHARSSHCLLSDAWCSSPTTPLGPVSASMR